MRNYYIGIGIIGVLVTILVSVGFYMVGSPISVRDQQYDEKRLSDFDDLSYDIENYYNDNQRLPQTLNEMTGSTTSRDDPQTKQQYVYNRVNDTNYKLCTTFSTESTDPKQKSHPISREFSSLVNSPQSHHKGFDCIPYAIAKDDIISPTPKPAAVQIIPGNLLANNSFEQYAYPDTFSNWTVAPGSFIRAVGEPYDGIQSIMFLPQHPGNSIISSSRMPITRNTVYEASLWYKSDAQCVSCAVAGFQFFDAAGHEIAQVGSQILDQCGAYDSTSKMWYRFISRPAHDYTNFTSVCTPPVTNATSFVFKIGLLNESDASWQFDTLSITPQRFYPGITPSVQPTLNIQISGYPMR